MKRLIIVWASMIIASSIRAAEFVSLPVAVPLPDTTQAALAEAKTAKGSPLWKLVFFGYTNCTDICPMSAGNAHKIVRDLRHQGLDIGNVFVTLDSERDSEETLKNYLSVFPETFGYIRADDSTMAALKASFGVEAIAYNKNPDNPRYLIDHSTSTFLVYKNREILAILDLFEHDLDDQAIKNGILKRVGIALVNQGVQ